MKQVKVTITGDLIGIDYCSKDKYKEEYFDEEDMFLSNYYTCMGWEKITGLYLEVPNDTYEFDDYENLVNKKGKYIKTLEYFHDLFREDGEHSLPVKLHIRGFVHQSGDYIIELEDDEEFDIKKVQLVKSDYEVEVFPYFIIADYILYNGKEIYNDGSFDDYDVESKCYNEFEVHGYVKG